MTAGLIALGVAAALSFVLIARDPAVGLGPGRFIVAASWPAMLGLFALLNTGERDRLGFAGVIGAVCVATLGRPALIMDRALTREAARDPALNKRKAAGIIAFIAAALVAAAWATMGD